MNLRTQIYSTDWMKKSWGFLFFVFLMFLRNKLYLEIFWWCFSLQQASLPPKGSVVIICLTGIALWSRTRTVCIVNATWPKDHMSWLLCNRYVTSWPIEAEGEGLALFALEMSPSKDWNYDVVTASYSLVSYLVWWCHWGKMVVKTIVLQ